MREYIKECLLRYPPDKFPTQFVHCVFEKAKDNERGEKLVRRGTQALVELSDQNGQGAYIPLDEIKQRAGIGGIGKGGSSGSSGLWVWGEKQASVLEVRAKPKAYKIRKEFWEAMMQLFGSPSTTAKRSIIELEGLGKEIWEGIDPKEYVEKERQSWSG